MPTFIIAPDNPRQDCDWVGNNAAFCCPVCQKVFIVSNGLVGGRPLPGHDAQGVRRCPGCRKSKATVNGGASSAPRTEARIRW